MAENMHEHINDAEAAIEPRSSPRRTVDSVEPNSHREVLDQAMRALAEASSILVGDVSNSEPLTKRRKKRKAEAENSVSHSQPTEPQNDRRRRGSSGTPRPRKSRGPSLPPFDPHADPGEDLDPTVVTMASLCNDTGQGRISSKAAEVLSNHATWKAQNRAKRARMKTLMELKKYGREEDAEEAEENQNASVSKDPQSSNPVTATSGGPPVLNDTEGGFDYSQDLQASRYNVQVRIGPNGETIIDEESLVVDRTEVEDTTSYTHVVESDHTKFVNSGTYGRRYRGSRWSAEETELFYDASYNPFEGVLGFHHFILRPSRSTVKTMNSLHTYCLVVTESRARINSKRKTKKILQGSIIVFAIVHLLVRSIPRFPSSQNARTYVPRHGNSLENDRKELFRTSAGNSCSNSTSSARG